MCVCVCTLNGPRTFKSLLRITRTRTENLLLYNADFCTADRHIIKLTGVFFYSTCEDMFLK